MKDGSSFDLKPVGLTILLFFVLVMLLAGVYQVSALKVEDSIRGSAQTVLAQWNDKPPKIGERITLPETGWSYIWAFQTGKKGSSDEGQVFVLRITGNSGPYTAVFYRTLKGGTNFCGLAGVQSTGTDASKYGITGRITRMWIDRLNALAARGANE